MPDNVDIQLNKIQHNINAVNLLTVQSDTLFNSFRGTVDSTNKKLDSLSSIVQDLSSKMQKLNNQSSEQSGFSAFMKGLNQTLYTSIGAVLGTPAGMSVQGAFAGQVVYEIVAGLGSLIDKAIYDATNSPPTDNTRKGDNSMVSYYDEQEKKIRFEKVQKLKYSDDWSNPQKIAGNFIGRQIGYFNNQLSNSPKQQKTFRTKKRKYSKSQNNTHQNPFNDFVLQLQAFIALIQQKFDEADFTKKLEEKTNITADALGNLSKKINSELTDDYVTPGRRYSVDSDHYKTKPKYPRGEDAELQFDAHGKAFAKSDPDKKNIAGGAKRNTGPGPLEIFEGVTGEAQKIGGALTTIMQTLNIGADTFVGGIINGFNSALTIIQSMIAVMQAVNTIKMFLPFATGGSVPGIGDTDSVPAVLTPGEYVIKKSVVNKFGTGFFEWINGGGLTNSLAGHYAGGGMVAAGARQMVAVSIPDVKIKGSDLYLSWRRENNTHGRRSI